MLTYTALKNLYTNLSNNSSTTNDSLGGTLINNEHRYLIQKYFDNESTYTTTTIGAESITFTGSLASGATSATLTAAWTHLTVEQFVVFSNSDQRSVLFTKGSTSVTWSTGLSSTATTSARTIGVQFYPIPPNVSKIKNDTITVGQLQYTPAPVRTIQEWTQLNALPYTSNIPNYYFIYNNKVGFWPIPSSSGNIITFNNKKRIPDLSFADYSTGTLSGLAVGSTSVTGVSTWWNTTGLFPINTDLSYFNLALKINPPNGDGIWYPIQSFQSDSALTLVQPLQTAPSTTATSYTIGQLPILQEDFQDMLAYGALKIYFSSIVEDKGKYAQFDKEYETRLNLLEAYAGTKSINVDLGSQPIPSNPNLYLFGTT